MPQNYDDELPIIDVSEIFEPRQYADIQAFYEENGFVLIQLLDRRACTNAIKEQVEKILLKQPWEERLIVLDPVTKTEIVYSPETSDAYVDALIQPEIRSKVLKGYKDAFPFHRGFGACCDPVVFNLDTVWQIRENPDIVHNAASLIGVRKEDLWVDINRSIHKLPTEGDNAFLHWDLQKFGPYQPDTSVQGKVLYSTGQFVCVPGSHTEKFHDLFNREYRSAYSEMIRKNLAMTKLDPEKPDPLDLISKTCSFRIPAGCCVFWSTNLLHGHKKTPRYAGPEFGMYLGYMMKNDRPAYKKIADKVKAADIETYGTESELWNRPTTEIEDRIYSYEHGVAPILWPSLEPIQFYPKKFRNYPTILAAYVSRMKAEDQQKYLRVREIGTDGEGRMGYDLLPWENIPYVPYPLSPLGRSLLA